MSKMDEFLSGDGLILIWANVFLFVVLALELKTVFGGIFCTH